jgi:hypothetical protein
VSPYQALADTVLLLHFTVVLFIVAGLVLVVAGNVVWHWRWVNNMWFRLAHVAAIGVVVLQSWLGQLCPLTTLESWLRVKAGSPSYSKSFMEHWVQRVLFYEAPFWLFALAYTVFGLLVVFAWWRFPPRRTERGHKNDA